MSNNDNNLANKLNGVSKSYHYNLPQEVRDLLAQAATVIAAKNSNNDKLTVNGIPNIKNPIVLGALLDTVGINLTNTLNAITLRAQADGADDEGTIIMLEMQTLVTIQQLLQQLRYSVDATFDNMDEVRAITGVILDEMDAWKKANKATMMDDIAKIRAIAKELGIEDYAEDFLREHDMIQPSAADVADSILNDLRETGTIGGSRAV
jgi:hypothetical protein